MTDTNINSDDNCCEHGVPYFVDCKRCRESEDLSPRESDILPDPRIAVLEADLAEALELLEQYAKDASGFASGQAWLYLDRQRVSVRVLAKHGRFKITRDDDWTEGEWVQ